MRRSRLRSSASVVLLSLTLAGCGGSGDEARGEEGGSWEIDAEPVLSIGVLDGDAPYLFNRIAAVRLLPDGRIAVADGGSSTVRIFRADGGFERQLGREGQGPGEFRFLTSLRVVRPDTLVVHDWGNQRLSRLLVSGELIGSHTLRGEDGLPETYLGSVGPDAHVFSWIKSGQRRALGATPTSDSVRFGLVRQDTLWSIWATEPGMRRVAVPGYGTGPLPFSPHVVSAMVGDTLFYTNGLGGLIRATGPGGDPVRSFSVPLEPWTPREASARLEPRLDSADGDRFLVMMEMAGASQIPTISDMLADPESNLWIKRYEPATDSHSIGRPRTGGEWLVVSTDGRVVAKVTVPDGFRLMEISRDRVAGVMRDALDVERVLVFDLRRS